MRKFFPALMVVLAMGGSALAAEKTIVETAASNPQFSTLVTAVKEAGLVEALQGEGPFTVLAPTNDAFDKLPKGTLEALLKDKAKLAEILKYHVIPAEAMAADVVKLDGKTVKTLQGSAAPISVEGGNVMIGKAKVIKTDIQCSNGVIHVIDTVLLPPSK